MSDTPIKDEPGVPWPRGPTDPGATKETAIEVDDDGNAVADDDNDDGDNQDQILTSDTHQGHPPAVPQEPLTPTANTEALIGPERRQSPPLRLGNSMLSNTARSSERHGLQQMRLLRKRLKSSISNEGYGPIHGAPAVPAPPSNYVPGPPAAGLAEQQLDPEPTSFERAKAEYEAKKANSKTTFEEDIEFLMLVGQEETRAKQVAEDARYEEECRDMEAGGSDAAQSNPEDIFVEQTSRRRRGKRNMDWPGQMEDEEDVFDDAGEGPSRAGRSTKRKNSPKSPARKRAKNGGGKKKKNQRGSSPQPEPSDNGIRTLGSLMPSDVFRDAAANQNAPELPEITDTRKAEALKKLIASVPESQRRKALTDRNELLNASKKFSHRGARPDGAGGWKITGMVTSLQNHQMIGTGFMRERERADEKPFGGICADAMGLGKTLEMIANIINERPKKPKLGEPKGTLIVLPATLVTQWHDELKKHVDPRQKLQVLTWKTGSRLETGDAVELLEKFDIVLTTYHEVQQSYPKTEIPLHLQTSEAKSEWWKAYFEENKGYLHRVQWRRVVLDEAQAIKNFRSKTSLACRALPAKYKWALSGTPIMNSALELYPYFKFLEVPYTGSFRIFKANYYNEAGEGQEPMERLSIMVNRFMIRRTHKNTMFGAPIVRLPKADDRIHWVQFNDLERAIYEIVRQRMVTQINNFAREDKLQRNYRNMLTMLLRLRQMTGNVLLIEVVMKDLLEREDHEKIRELAETEMRGDAVRRAQLVELRRLLAKPPPDHDDADAPEETRPGWLDDVPDDEVDIGRAHGRTFSFGKYLKDLRDGKDWEQLKKRTLCVVCRQPPDLPYVTACYHIYCRECLEVLQHDWAARHEARARCAECQCEYSWAHPCDEFEIESILSDIEDEDINADAPPVQRWREKKSGKGKGKGKGKLDEGSVTRSWIQKNGTVLPSAKTIAVKAQILNWLQQDPDAKILVYTQFISMVHIMMKICEMEDWRHLEYTGQQSIAKRDKTLERFKKENVSILVASLKCGGLGLNLTAAKHVISIDPWWNSAIEQQAFCRVFRIGQTEETSMTRFVVAGTIDEKLINMQERKQKEIDRVMGDSGQPRENLSVQDMMRLFGPVREDGRGRPFVVGEDKETLPRYNADSEDEGDDD